MRQLAPLFALLLLWGCGEPTETPTEAPAEPAKAPPEMQQPDTLAAEPAPKSSIDEKSLIDEKALMLPAELTRCPDERPQACTMEYDPVQGYLSSGEQKEYSNGCSACSDPQVIGYLKSDTLLQ